MSTTVRISAPTESDPTNVSGNSVSVASVSADAGPTEGLPWQLLGEYTGPVESVLPREFRQRLHKHFARIEREFEREYRRLYGENLALQERLEKFEDGDHSESTTLAKKLGASLLSQRIKQQYKQSTSRLVSSLFQSTGHATGPPSGSATAALASGPVTGPSQSHAALPFSGTFSGHTGSSWQLVHRIVGQHRDGIWEVTPYRRFLATASADSTVRLWNNDAQMNCILVYLGHSGSVNSVRFRSRDHLLLTSSGDGTAHLIRLPFELLVKAASSTMAMTTSSASALGAASTATTVATATSSMTASEAIEAATTALTSDMAGSGVKAGGFMGLSHDLDPGYPDHGESEVFPSRSAGGALTIPIHLRHPHAIFQSANLCTPPGASNGSTAVSDISSAPLSAADFLTGRDQVVAASWDRLGRIYDLATGQEVCSLTGHDHQLTDVRCAPGGSPMVATASRDCTFRVWDFRQPGMRVNVQQAHNQPVSTAQFVVGAGGSVDGLISAGADRFCRLWDLRNTRGPLFSLRTDASINRLAISGSGGLHHDPAVDSSCPSSLVLSDLASTGGELSAPPVAGGGETQIAGGGCGEKISSSLAPGTGRVGAGQSGWWSTSHTRILALPLDNRGVKLFDLSGNRIGSLTRSSSRSHARMVTSVAWADEGACNFFSVGFDARLLGWQIHYA